MYKPLFYLFTFLIFNTSLSQVNEGYKITYEKKYNGNTIDNENPIFCFSTNEKNYIYSRKIDENKAEYPYEYTLVFPKRNEVEKLSRLSENKLIKTKDSTSLSGYEYIINDSEQRTICGFLCKKATTTINSNHYTIWYTNELKITGGPTTLGQNLGLVLEINRNNNFIISASKVEKGRSILPNTTNVHNFNNLDYQDLVWKSRFISLSVFKEEIINFSDTSKSNDSILKFANGTIILRKIKFPKIESTNLTFIDLSLQSNGDAYDRTGSLFLIPSDKKISFLDALENTIEKLPVYQNGNGKLYQGVVSTTEYSPLIELMRFFTPFGIHHYNSIAIKNKTWHDVANYRQDISDFNSLLSEKEFWIGAFIGNYDKGGHKTSLNITIHKEGTKNKQKDFIFPLFNTTNVMEMAGQNYATMFDNEKGLTVTFNLKSEVKNAKIRYISTGHGGWENGDEFLPKKNTILLNGEIIHEFYPWREDCGSYRLFNPASGNFNNGLSSSDYSRSNWCPGMVTYPHYIEIGDLNAGEHTIQIKIPQGAPEGGSFSSWNISGVLIGN